MSKFLLLAVLFFIWAPSAIVQGAVSLDVWPPRVDLNVIPGEDRTGVINVRNTGNERAQVFCYISDLAMDKHGNLQFPEGGTLPTSCEPWIIINPENFTISQGVSQQVRYTFKVPDDASGSYLSSVFFQTKPQEDVKKSGSKLSARVGVLFNIAITGTGIKDGEISSLSLSNTVRSNTAQVELGFVNKGNMLLRPTGTVEIKTDDGWTVEKLALNADRQAVLPRSERIFRIPLPAVKPGSYNLFATVDYGGSEILSGEARVNLILAEASRHSWPIAQPKAPVKAPAKPAQPAVKASPEEIKSLYDTATRQYTSGDYQASLASWQKLLKLDPGNAAAKKNLERTKAKLDALKNIKG